MRPPSAVSPAAACAAPFPRGVSPSRLAGQHLHDRAGRIELGEVEIGRRDAGRSVGRRGCALRRDERRHVVGHLVDLVRALVEEAAPAHQRIGSARRLRHLLRAHDQADRAVAARRHLVEPERLDDRPRGQHLVQRQRLLELGDRVERGVAPVLDGDTCQLGPRGADARACSARHPSRTRRSG